MSTTAESIEAIAAELDLTMRAEFVPWSLSRNAGEKSPSLNWKVSLLKAGTVFLTTDYMAGCGHAPSYKQGRQTVDEATRVRRECETGAAWASGHRRILPKFADVLHSLASDADVIDYRSFEDWAESMGMDADSRKAETVYRACLDIALKMRAAMGEAGLARLREAVQDY